MRAQKRVQLPTGCPTVSPTEMDPVSPRPDTPLLDAAREVTIRQDLTLVALGRRKADKVLRVGRLLDVHTRTWQTDWEIVIKGARIAWVGPAGVYEGEAADRVHAPTLVAVPGFGEECADDMIANLARRQYVDARPWREGGLEALRQEEVRRRLAERIPRRRTSVYQTRAEERLLGPQRKPSPGFRFLLLRGPRPLR